VLLVDVGSLVLEIIGLFFVYQYRILHQGKIKLQMQVEEFLQYLSSLVEHFLNAQWIR
jgi:hypothetical protein